MGVLFLFCSSAFAAIPYQSIPVDACFATTGAIWDTTEGAIYGKAEIESWYWQDTIEVEGTPKDFWFYTYVIRNDKITYDGGSGEGSASDPPVGYHLGWEMGSDHTYRRGINLLSLTGFDSVNPGVGPDDLEATGSASSSSGGDAWTIAAFDVGAVSGSTGLDWSNSSGNRIWANTWRYIDQGGTKNDRWERWFDGDTSSDQFDLFQHFQIASQWGPGECIGELIVPIGGGDPQLHPIGTIIGPTEIPEPATFMILALGSLALSHRRAKRRFTS